MAYYYYKEFNKVELHYWLEHGFHRMDAIVQNKCEHEFLSLLLEIAEIFDTDIYISTEPLAEGGLRRFYNVISREEARKATITTAVVVALATTILVTPISTSITRLTEIAIEKIFEDQELKKQQDEKSRLELIKIKQEITLDSLLIVRNLDIEKRRSSFYQQLAESDNVENVSLILNNEKNNPISQGVVDRSDFKEMIASSTLDEKIRLIEPSHIISSKYLIEESIEEEIQDVNIEVISPDFSSGSDKWKGMYDGKVITFKIVSLEFKNLVQSGNIQFRKGSIITCDLKIKRKSQRTKTYEVLNVNRYLD